MSKLLHNVTLEVFIKAQDSKDSIFSALNQFSPLAITQILETQWKWLPTKQHTKVYALPKKGITLLEAESPGEEGTITVLTLKYNKQKDIKEFLNKLQTLNQDERNDILTHLENNIDGDGRLLLRFDLEYLEKGKLKLKPSGKCLFARLNLAAFPKKQETCVEIAREILS